MNTDPKHCPIVWEFKLRRVTIVQGPWDSAGEPLAVAKQAERAGGGGGGGGLLSTQQSGTDPPPTTRGAETHHFTADPDPIFYFNADPDPPPSTGVRIRINLMRIRIQVFTSMRIRIQLFTLMRVLIQLFTSIRIRIQLFTLRADPDPAFYFKGGSGSKFSLKIADPDPAFHFRSTLQRFSGSICTTICFMDKNSECGSGSRWSSIGIFSITLQ